MEILELELKYVELQSFLNEPSSKRTKLIRISEFYDFALSISNLSLIEAYISEFLPKYFTLIKFIKIRGLNPEVLVKLQDQLSKLNKFNFVQNYGQEIEGSFTILKNKYELLSSWLSGHLTNPNNNLIYFPVLEKSGYNKIFGFLEIIKVGISDGESKFIIEPAESEEDDQLEKQLHLCWEVAVDYCKKYIKKIKQNHTVELKFENKLGVYVGNSFGIALTLAFIEALLKHYNSRIIVNINGCIAVTGGIDKNSEIILTSKTIIESKVETVFYSDAHIFCVPKKDEIWAEEKLKELKLLFPKRDLRIIGLTNLNDLLDRRQIVDVRKQKLVVRSGKFVKKNWISAIATVLLAILFSYLFVMDFDDNPARVDADGSVLYVKNKNGKVLWTKLVDVSKVELKSNSFYSREAKVADINNDRLNEIIICGERDPRTNLIKNSAMVVCYNSGGEEVWDYIFQDTVLSEREILNTEYSVRILDTLTIYGRKSLLLSASNVPSFSSAIFRLDLKTGKRLPGTFWASGHIMEGSIKDIDNDYKPEVVSVGYENGFEDFVFFVYELDTLIKVRPTTEQYLIKKYPVSNMKSYIRFPKTDFDNYFGKRTPGYSMNSFSKDDNNLKYIFSTSLPHTSDEAAVGYEISYDLKNINVVIDSDFRIQRDTLIAHHKLKPPYTDTEEYKEIIKNRILYWKDGKWVTREELD